MEGERGLPDRVPKILALPWKETANHHGLAPCDTFASTVLCNWKLLDTSGSMDGNSLHAVSTFTGTKWFYIHCDLSSNSVLLIGTETGPRSPILEWQNFWQAIAF